MAENAQLGNISMPSMKITTSATKSVFSDGITIEDTLSVLVKYQNQVQLTYSLNAYLPWEGLERGLAAPKVVWR